MDDILKSFDIGLDEFEKIAGNFSKEMKRGLIGGTSSLKMIPSYASIPSGKERGTFLALDLGGTNVRVLRVELLGRGKFGQVKMMRFKPGKHVTNGSSDVFFGFLAKSIKTFIKKNKLGAKNPIKLGFTFSFPIAQYGIASGRLIKWTKGFNVRGALNKNVVSLLQKALTKEGIDNISVEALINDTVGTLLAKSYEEPVCDIGVIIGTGTNACYPEAIQNIKKLPGRCHCTSSERMVINIEWGNFNKLPMTAFDRILDENSDNPGEQILEKMVSGKYLGEIVRLVLRELSKSKNICPAYYDKLSIKGFIRSEFISEIEGISIRQLKRSATIMNSIGLKGSSENDRLWIRRVCESVSKRAARISASLIVSIIKKMDNGMSRHHIVAVDGSVFEKHPIFFSNMQSAIEEMLGSDAKKITFSLAKDGSGRGAAVAAAMQL